MRTGAKIAVSTLISLFLFTGLTVASYAGLFSILENRFYAPSIIKNYSDQGERAARILDSWHSDNVAAFSTFTANEAVTRSLLPNQSSQDIFDRTNLAGTLMAGTRGLEGIRIIDSGESIRENDTGNRRIHFSTFTQDILRKEDFLISWKQYGRDDADIPFARIARSDGDSARLILDTERDRYLYTFPFYDSYGTWRGTAVFYVSARAAVQKLIGEGLLRLSDHPVLIATEDALVYGAVTGMPSAGRDFLTNVIIDRWTKNDLAADRIVGTGESGWVLVSKKAGEWGIYGQLVDEQLFSFPKSVRTLFLAVSFLTMFLVIFLLFNLKQDEMVIIRSRIRRFQVNLMEELMETDEEQQWEELRKNLTGKKREFNDRIKRGFGRRVKRKHSEAIDQLLDKSWEEILTAIGRKEHTQKIGTEEIRLMLEQVLQNNAISLNLTNVTTGMQSQRPVAPDTTPPDAMEDLEEVEELDEVESVEELDEVESVEELDEVESVEELDEVESVEELDEVESVEELDTDPAYAPAEPDEVEYLDGEWEVELLDVATDEELAEFIEESVPDDILVYDFGEKPGFDEPVRPIPAEQESYSFAEFEISGLDFTSLDELLSDTTEAEEDAENAIWIGDILPGQTPSRSILLSERHPVEFLEVIGEDEPSPLLDVEETQNDGGTIINRDGIYVISAATKLEDPEGINSDFRELVNSVLH
ncbi:MAG TPA: hypothetical protein PKH81_00050 [Treponemataceae bacterium]|nr:hypothetical protein [Treponemataceae bacterium]